MAWHSLSSSDPREALRCTCGVSRVPEEWGAEAPESFTHARSALSLSLSSP